VSEGQTDRQIDRLSDGQKRIVLCIAVLCMHNCAMVTSDNLILLKHK